jgi:hypothetical protein
MDYSEFSNEQLIAEYYHQENLYFEYNNELFQTGKPVDGDWHEKMGMRDGCNMVMGEIAEELNKRNVYLDNNNVWGGNAFDSGESRDKAKTYSEFD